jgi:EAL domain-containing protein (putative c-di-GMP-specific phosphodiesterase class I)
VVGVEALARWEHRTLGQIGPGEFVPIAEDTGLMVALGTQILHTACADVASWQRADRCRADLRLNVNLSPRQLSDPALVPAVAEILELSGLDPALLWLEVTESVLMEDATFVSRTLAQLRELGVHFAIDDFGTGYSSLAYLQQFPVSHIKIDGSFVTQLDDPTRGPGVAAAIIEIGRALGMATIAEGIETERQLERLCALGCALGQGYLLGRPLEASVMLELVTGSRDSHFLSAA